MAPALALGPAAATTFGFAPEISSELDWEEIKRQRQLAKIINFQFFYGMNGTL
jgi:hypothetical protein